MRWRPGFPSTSAPSAISRKSARLCQNPLAVRVKELADPSCLLTAELDLRPAVLLRQTANLQRASHN